MTTAQAEIGVGKSAIEPILRAHRQGSSALFVCGRSLHDLSLDGERIRPIIEILRRELWSSAGLYLLTYSLSAHLDADLSRVDDQRNREVITDALMSHGLSADRANDQTAPQTLRSLAALCQTPAGNRKWVDGRPARFAVAVLFGDHIAPCGAGGGSASETTIASAEVLHDIGCSLALRAAGNLFLVYGQDGLVDELVRSSFIRVRLPLPGTEEKRAFIAAAQAVYTQASLEPGQDADGVATLTAKTPNRSIEASFRASHLTREPIRTADLIAQRVQDVRTLSDGSLVQIPADRVRGVRLVGVTVERPAAVLAKMALALRSGDRRLPALVLLAGAPGTGKTDLAVAAAAQAGVPAFEMQSPKRPLVGETERVARLQHELLAEFSPALAFVDEVTEAFPMERSEFDGDSGASRSVMASWLTSLSDGSRRGRVLTVATTNVPERIGAAMLSRFFVVPVLQPFPSDYPALLESCVARIAPALDLTARKEEVRVAAEIFYRQGASARSIQDTLATSCLSRSLEDKGALVAAANDYCGETDRGSAAYADLWALKCCSSKAVLPFTTSSEVPRLPTHLDGVLDITTGDINRVELNRRIRDLRPSANV